MEIVKGVHDLAFVLVLIALVMLAITSLMGLGTTLYRPMAQGIGEEIFYGEFHHADFSFSAAGSFTVKGNGSIWKNAKTCGHLTATSA
jgi:hypothetical protein